MRESCPKNPQPMTSRILDTMRMLLVLVGCLFAINASAASGPLDALRHSGELRVGIATGYMPFEMIDRRAGMRQRYLPPGTPRHQAQNAVFIGFDIDIAREMAKELGLRLSVQNISWGNLIPSLNARRIDVIVAGMSITESRKRLVLFSEPYMSVGQTVLISTRHRDEVATLDDLNKPSYRVAFKPGTTGELAVQQYLPDAGRLPMVSEQQAIKAVRDGRADAFVYDSPHNALLLAMDDNDELLLLDQPLTQESLALAVRKDNQELVDWLNEFLGRLRADGRYQRFYDKWFVSSDWFDLVQH